MAYQTGPVDEISRATTTQWNIYNAWPGRGDAVALPDSSGSLRIARSKGIVRTYLWHHDQWKELSAQAISGKIWVGMTLSSSANYWQQMNVSAGFDSFVITAQGATCPAGSDPRNPWRRVARVLFGLCPRVFWADRSLSETEVGGRPASSGRQAIEQPGCSSAAKASAQRRLSSPLHRASKARGRKQGFAYRPPESNAPNANVYAAKGHPELTGADLVVAYATNTYPHFVRLTFDGADV